MTEDRSILSRAAAPPAATLAYGPEPEHIADIRSPAAGGAERPLVMLIHGGFWRPAYDRLHLGCLAAAISALGYTVANVEYRRIPGEPAQTIGDLQRAVAQLPAALQASSNGELILIGHSAGGHLALLAAAQDAGHRVRGVLALAPVADLEQAIALNLGDGAVAAFLGPELAHRSRFDPTALDSVPGAVRIAHGEQDEIVPLALSETYSARHPRAQLKRLPQTGHFALIDPDDDAWGAVREQLEQLLR